MQSRTTKSSKPSFLIRNISKEDAPLLAAAEKLGYSVVGLILDNNLSEISKFKFEFPKIKLYVLRTAFQRKYSFWLSQFINILILAFIKILHRPVVEIRSPRYVETNVFHILLGSLIPFLRPYLRFQNTAWEKDQYLSILQENGLPIPKIYAVLKDNQEPSESLIQSLEFPCLCKPASGTGGIGVFLAQNAQDLQTLYSYEKKLTDQNDISLYYRNKTKKGFRNYLYNSNPMGGRYIFQKYILGRVFSISAAKYKNQLYSAFCYEIHSVKNAFFAEQGFSWPIDQTIEEKMIQLTTDLAKSLNYPDGPLMVDFIYDENYQLHVIDAGPRASVTATKLSSFVFQDNEHAEILLLSHTDQTLQMNQNRVGRPVFWQRLPLPKGKYKTIQYPNFDRPEVIHTYFPVTTGTQVYEPRTDRHMTMRGDFATTGSTVDSAKENWDHLFKEVTWHLEK